MKVKCIDNRNNKLHLTIDKTYEVIEITEIGDYWIINDVYNEWLYDKKLFKLLSEIRIEKINKLLSE